VKRANNRNKENESEAAKYIEVAAKYCVEKRKKRSGVQGENARSHTRERSSLFTEKGRKSRRTAKREMLSQKDSYNALEKKPTVDKDREKQLIDQGRGKSGKTN